MASIFEKEPFFQGKKKWDANSKLPEVYKLQSNDPANKAKAKVFRDNGAFGLEWTIDCTIPDFNAGTVKINLGYRYSYAEFENCLGGALKSAWKHVVDTHFPEPTDPTVAVPSAQDRDNAENFPKALELWLQRAHNEKKMRDRQWIYLAPGGTYVFKKELKTKPVDHQHRFEELVRLTKLLPAGDIADPNEGLQVEWFYNSFHKEDRAEYVKSGQKLAKESIESLVEYFGTIYETQVINGELDRKREALVRASENRRVRRELRERYVRKLDYYADKRRTSRSRDQHRERRERRNKSHERGDYKGGNRQNDKRDYEGKSFKPCHVHGEQAKHSYDDCRTNPKNRNKGYAGHKKREHASHHVAHDDNKDDESSASSRTSRGSGESTGSSESSCETPMHDSHHVEFHIPRKRSSPDVTQLAAKKTRKGEKPAGQIDDFSFLADEFEDCMDLEIGNTSPIGTLDDVTNPLEFGI